MLVNLGTPAAPDARAVRRFLREFLSDPRVVEIPRVIWWPILYGLVLPLRPRKTAAKYAAIWSEQGSPLMVYSRQQALLLRGYLGERGLDVEVALAMRYGEPSIASALAELRQKNVDRLLVLPMYPQYSATTTASVFDAVADHVKTIRNVPEMRWVKHFHDHAGYIEALRRSVLDHWTRFGALGKGGKLVISFHGVPKRTLDLGDPYHCECQKTGRLLAESLGLGAGDYVVTFQSRFGRAEWLQPYTAPTLRKLAADGCARVDVICPGFATDCLETLEEIAIEGKNEFLSARRQAVSLHCLPEWCAGLYRGAGRSRAAADAGLADSVDVEVRCRGARRAGTKKPRTSAAAGCGELIDRVALTTGPIAASARRRSRARYRPR